MDKFDKLGKGIVLTPQEKLKMKHISVGLYILSAIISAIITGLILYYFIFPIEYLYENEYLSNIIALGIFGLTYLI